MTRTELRGSVLAVLGGGFLLQAGCVGFLQRELEALLAPVSPDNAALVLNSVFFDLLAPLFF